MPNSWERLHLDFDGYFAAVEEQASPALHGRPVAVLPYPEARTCVISANAAAKRHGVGTGTGVDEARRRCPGIALVSQRPDLYVRVQRRNRERGGGHSQTSVPPSARPAWTWTRRRRSKRWPERSTPAKPRTCR